MEDLQVALSRRVKDIVEAENLFCTRDDCIIVQGGVEIDENGEWAVLLLWQNNFDFEEMGIYKTVRL